MGRTYESIDGNLIEWVGRQAVFFVATAPPGSDGHINLSPKGLDTFRVLGPHRVAYLDLTGSGVETIAHLRADGRITLMFCAFEGPPRIVRFFGRGSVTELGDPRWKSAAAQFPAMPGSRAVIEVAVERIADSCGYAVPLMELTGHRTRLIEWAENRGPDGIAEYHATRNAESIDGLPGLTLNPQQT